MRERQQRLELGTGARRALRNDDYINLFPYNIFPTGEIDVLERHGHLLIIKAYEYGKLGKMPKAHSRIWKLMANPTSGAGYSNPDSPGSITVVCVEGLGPTPRNWLWYDQQGEHPAVTGTREEWRAWLLNWERTYGIRL